MEDFIRLKRFLQIKLQHSSVRAMLTVSVDRISTELSK